MCGKAYDPTFIFAWPNAKYAVMGADQASGVIFDIHKNAAERAGHPMESEELDALREQVRQGYVNTFSAIESTTYVRWRVESCTRHTRSKYLW
jgi:acetyl-CoA carboxylase carboxyltransferase component